MTKYGGNGTTIIGKAVDIGDLGVIKLLPLWNLYVGRCTKGNGISTFFQKIT